ncbi:50S ribosomal protein L15 [Desulfatirhabdium butyrativorans]|uniref:50S ribosomal protein L15 n=1 Tax=Desulfatirhabdium butyrativorans TaxID=340467 RepID=UPI00040C8B15|nr:50S ribosomal protein L15 [Desulfatirhabdium butyrativorans]
MKLHELKPAEGSKKKRKRIGRGESSGYGKTSGKGAKGQNARSGGGVRPGFEGGQMPIHRRLPKRGFTPYDQKKIAVVNVKDLFRFDANSLIDEAALRGAGLVKGVYDQVKLLGKGEISVPVTIKLHLISAAAREKILAAGGTVEVSV